MSWAAGAAELMGNSKAAKSIMDFDDTMSDLGIGKSKTMGMESQQQSLPMQNFANPAQNQQVIKSFQEYMNQRLRGPYG